MLTWLKPEIVTKTVQVELTYPEPSTCTDHIEHLIKHLGTFMPEALKASLFDQLADLVVQANYECDRNTSMALWLNHHPANSVCGEKHLHFELNERNQMGVMLKVDLPHDKQQTPRSLL